MMEKDALGRERKNLWVAKREEIKPDLPQLPKLEGRAPESKVLSDTGWTDGVQDFVGAKDQFSKGYARFLRFVREQREGKRPEKDILEAGASFVQRYPEAMPGTTAQFAQGLRAALQAFKSQVEGGELSMKADRVGRTPSAPEKEAVKAERRDARAAKKKAAELEAAKAARSRAAKKGAKARAAARSTKAGKGAKKSAKPAGKAKAKAAPKKAAKPAGKAAAKKGKAAKRAGPKRAKSAKKAR